MVSRGSEFDSQWWHYVSRGFPFVKAKKLRRLRDSNALHTFLGQKFKQLDHRAQNSFKWSALYFSHPPTPKHPSPTQSPKKNRKVAKLENHKIEKIGISKNWKFGISGIQNIGKSEYWIFGKSENRKFGRNSDIRKIGNLEYRKFGKH